jgi:uncharacterized protein YqgC (DUF456 family)
MSSLIIWTLTSAILGLGLLGILVPGVPGIGLVYVGIVFYALLTNFTTITGTSLIVFGVLTLVTWLAGYIGTDFGSS